MKYAMIDQLRNQHPISRLCVLLDVAKSGYQAWRSGKVIPPRKLEDFRLLVAITAAHQRGRGIYGPKKIRDELADQGIVAGLNRIKRLRTLHDIRCTHNTLAWTAAGATSLSINQGVGTVTGTSVRVAPTSTLVYTLTATNGSGSVTATAGVTVVPAPTITSFTATPSAVVAGGASTLRAVFSQGTAVVDQAIGAVTTGTPTPTGAIAGSTTYTLPRGGNRHGEPDQKRHGCGHRGRGANDRLVRCDGKHADHWHGHHADRDVRW